MGRCKFFVDFESIAGYYVKTFTIKEISAAAPTIVLMIKLPKNWCDIVFKQLNRSIYYGAQHYILDWCDGDIDYDDWIAEVAKYIDFNQDQLYVNSMLKCLVLQWIFI